VLNRSCFLAGFGMLWAALANSGPDGPTPAACVKLEVVKHKQFLEALGKQRGKVVVIDLWGEF